MNAKLDKEFNFEIDSVEVGESFEKSHVTLKVNYEGLIPGSEYNIASKGSIGAFNSRKQLVAMINIDYNGDRVFVKPLEVVAGKKFDLNSLFPQDCDFSYPVMENEAAIENGILTAPKAKTGSIIVNYTNEAEETDYFVLSYRVLFTDVIGSDLKGMPGYLYYYSPVYWAADNGITTGFGGTEFRPNASCARREMMIFLWRICGSPAPENDARDYFNDMKSYGESSATNKAVAWAYERGIAKGYSDGGFHPTASVNRKDTLIMLYRTIGKPDVEGELTFPDVIKKGYAPTSDTYKAILWAAENGITNGYADGTFKPEDPCTRAQIVTFLYRSESYFDYHVE